MSQSVLGVIKKQADSLRLTCKYVGARGCHVTWHRFPARLPHRRRPPSNSASLANIPPHTHTRARATTKRRTTYCCCCCSASRAALSKQTETAVKSQYQHLPASFNFSPNNNCAVRTFYSPHSLGPVFHCWLFKKFINIPIIRLEIWK